jgi:hypothetical protein
MAGVARIARPPVKAAPRPRTERRPSGVPATFDDRDMLRQKPGRMFPSLCGHIAASFVAFFKAYRHWLI